MTTQQKYDQWVAKVIPFLEETGKELNCCCSVMQSKPVFDKQPQVLFLGYNANEPYGYDGVDKQRFYEGNPFFNDKEERKKWQIWQRLYGAFEWSNHLEPVTDGNFVFMNAVYFGTSNIAALKAVQGSQKAIDQCLEYTSEVIQEVFKPKNIICFSNAECFNPLKAKYNFTEEEIIIPKMVNGEPASVEIHSAFWNGIPVYGIPHPSRMSYDNLGAVALYFKEVL